MLFRKILIDTGEPGVAEYGHLLEAALNTHGSTIDRILCTHWHFDHVGGVQNVFKMCEQRGHARPKAFKYPRATEEDRIQENEHVPHFDFLKDNQEVKVDGATLRVLFTPGHADDHICLYLVEENAIFSGDCILGEGTAKFRQVFEDFYDYMSSLKKLLSIHPSKIYPGHGPVIEDPKERIEYYIEHRMQREQQIIDVLKEADTKGLTAPQIVNRVYPDLNELLVLAAEQNVTLHLNKLAKEGKAALKDDQWILLDQ